MKRKVIAAALATALTAGIGTPAHAVSPVQFTGLVSTAAMVMQAMQQSREVTKPPSAPPAQTVKKMGLTAVTRAVSRSSPVVLSLNKTAAGIGAGGGSVDLSQMQGQIDQLQSLLSALQTAHDTALDGSAVKVVYGHQIALLQANIASLQGSMQTSAIVGAMTQSAYSDAEFGLRKLAANTEKQLCSAAESILIGMQSLSCAKQDLTRSLAALDRNLAVMKVQLDRGMIGPLAYESTRNMREQLAVNVGTLDQQYENLGSNLALLCGYDAGTRVVPDTLTFVSDSDLRAMKYETDLAAALKENYTIWKQKDAVREAANQRDKELDYTVDKYEAEQKKLIAVEEEQTLAFRACYDAVGEKQRARTVAQAAVVQAQSELEIARAKYQVGTIAKLGLQEAEDALAAAENAVTAAEYELLSAYRSYVWATKGLIPSAEQGGAS